MGLCKEKDLMKVRIRMFTPVEKTLTWSQIKVKPGLYRPKTSTTSHILILGEGIDPLFVTADRIERASDGWEGMLFVEATGDTVTITG